MAGLKFLPRFALVIIVILEDINTVKTQVHGSLDDDGERYPESLGGGRLLRKLDAISDGNLLRAIYRADKPRNFMRINRGLDSLSGASFGMAKRLDSLAGMGFGTEKRNLDEIDRSNFGTFSKRNLDEIDRSDFDRFAKRRQMEATNDESQRLAATTS